MNEKKSHQVVGRWKRQRLSAVLLIGLSIYLMMETLTQTQTDYLSVLKWVTQPWISIILAVFIGTAFYHSTLGMRVVFEDYVSHPLWQKICILTVQGFSISTTLLSWGFLIHIAIFSQG